MSGTSDGVIVVGAASKGIIQRDHQHNAVVYKTYYAPNPFDNMTEEEVEKYKKEVQGHGKEPGENPLMYPLTLTCALTWKNCIVSDLTKFGI